MDEPLHLRVKNTNITFSVLPQRAGRFWISLEHPLALICGTSYCMSSQDKHLLLSKNGTVSTAGAFRCFSCPFSIQDGAVY